MFSFFYFVTCKNKAYCSTKYNFFNFYFLQMAPLKFWFIYYSLFFSLYVAFVISSGADTLGLYDGSATIITFNNDEQIYQI